MDVSLDPEQRETQALLEVMGDLGGKRVLEIGCGDGRMTMRYAANAAQVICIDPDVDQINQAISITPPSLQDRVSFFADHLEGYAAKWQRTSLEERFDLLIFAWSL
jgi:cyclopropane fatty-acyl-phospholipid synthase-like methyltransferase